MSKFRIESEEGVVMGVWEASTPREAVRAMNRDAGYKTDADVLAVTGQRGIMEGLILEEVHDNRSGK